MTQQRQSGPGRGRGPGGRDGRGFGGPGGPGGRGRGRGRDRDRDRDDSGLEERVIKIRRVSKVVKGGRHLSFNALVVVGDGSGKVGMSLGKAKAVPDAVRKGTTNARRDMHDVVLNGTTIPHEIVAKFGSAKVFLKPAAPGTGVIAGGGVRAVMEVVGVKDVLSKTFGSSNTLNVVRATMRALGELRDPKRELNRRRGIKEPAADAPVAVEYPPSEPPAAETGEGS